MSTVLDIRMKRVECANDHAIRCSTIHRHFLKIISNISKNVAPYFYYCRVYKLGTYCHDCSNEILYHYFYTHTHTFEKYIHTLQRNFLTHSVYSQQLISTVNCFDIKFFRCNVPRRKYNYIKLRVTALDI